MNIEVSSQHDTVGITPILTLTAEVQAENYQLSDLANRLGLKLEWHSLGTCNLTLQLAKEVPSETKLAEKVASLEQQISNLTATASKRRRP